LILQHSDVIDICNANAAAVAASALQALLHSVFLNKLMHLMNSGVIDE